MNKAEKHYDIDYYENHQKKIGEFGGTANLYRFEKYITKNDAVMDFGCGGGFLLKNIECREKIGVELNDIARDYCINKNGINCFKDIDEIEDNSLDVIISNNCLEHTLAPYHLIEKMFNKLKIGGKIILVIPLDSYKYKWMPNDVNYHLYSFSPMNIGNLLDASGFKEITSNYFLHKWPPYYEKIQKYFGWNFFRICCKIYGRFNKRYVQVYGIGFK
jgi:SAM-dependent methyltransferase